MTNRQNRIQNISKCLKMFFGILVLSLQAPLVSPKESGPYYEHLQEMRGQLKKAGVLPASGTAAPKPLFLPVPLVPLKDSGQYYEHLQEMQEQLKKGDMICFYTLAQEFIDKVKGNRTIRRIEKRPENNREDAVAWMWWNYYLASAPLISFDQLEKGRIPNHDRYELDIDRKCDALSGFIGSEIEKKAEYFNIDARRLQENNIACMRAIMKMLLDGKKTWTRITVEARAVARKAIDEPMNIAGYDYEEFTWARFRLRNLPGIASRYSTRKNHFESRIRWIESSFVKYLSKAFPTDGTRVHEILMSSGYESKEACRDLLLRTVGQKKGYEYLYRGLPKLEKPKTGKK